MLLLQLQKLELLPKLMFKRHHYQGQILQNIILIQTTSLVRNLRKVHEEILNIKMLFLEELIYLNLLLYFISEIIIFKWF